MTNEGLKAIEEQIAAREHCHNFTGHEKHIQAIYLCEKCNDVDLMADQLSDLLAEVKRLRKLTAYHDDSFPSLCDCITLGKLTAADLDHVHDLSCYPCGDTNAEPICDW